MTRMAADPRSLFPGKFFISTVLDALDTKTTMSGAMARRYLQRAGMAGIIIGVLYAANFAMIAAFDAVTIGGTTLVTLGRVAGALTFGWALVFIYYTKSELLTSNMMIVTIGAYYKRTRWREAMRILGLCYLGNALGGLLVALLLRFSTILAGRPTELMIAASDRKLAFLTEGAAGWGDLLVRAILCNLLINISMLLVYNGLIKDDLTRSLAMIVAVFLFAFLGLEHSVANTVLFLIVGLRDGLEVGLALANLGIALVGNFIGGGLLIGLYYAYVNDDARYLREQPPVGPS